MTKTILFHPNATIEQRKAAINEALIEGMPFKLTKLLMNMTTGDSMEYTGGFTQMTLAESFTIQYNKRRWKR